MVPRVPNTRHSESMADHEQDSAGQAQTAGAGDANAETDGGNTVTGDTTTPLVASEVLPQSPVQMSDTRRTSQSSRSGEAMQASQMSMASGTEDGAEGASTTPGQQRGTQRRNRPQVSRLDYGTVMS